MEWDGLDDNFMPVVPGTYAAKAIATPSVVWPVDGKPHAITAEFAAAALPFAPTPQQVADNATGFFFKVIGDPVGSAMGAVAVDSVSSTAVFYHEYLENAMNNFVVNLTAPIGWSQCTSRSGSGGAAGGNATTTDGATVWSYTNNGGSVIYRSDERPFGRCKSEYRQDVYCPEGVVAGMSSARNANLNTSKLGFTTVVMVATRAGAWLPGSKDQVAFLDGYDSGAKVLATMALPGVTAIDARDDVLYALHAGRSISRLELQDGLPRPHAAWVKAFDIAAEDVPAPGLMAAGTGGKAIYVSDDLSNMVAKLDGATGKRLLNFGDDQAVPVPEPASGTYSRDRLMGPTSLAVWAMPGTAPDHVLVLETRGPARLGEWDSGSGTLVREWTTPQTKANDGYALDPAAPSQLYVMQSGTAQVPGWPAGGQYLVRYIVNYTTGRFAADAVFPNVSGRLGPQASFDHNGGNPTVIRHTGSDGKGVETYLAMQSGPSIYKFRAGKLRFCPRPFAVTCRRTHHPALPSCVRLDGHTRMPIAHLRRRCRAAVVVSGGGVCQVPVGSPVLFCCPRPGW